MIDISIIIVSYNTKDLLIHCLDSIFQNKNICPREVIVVDNASSDQTVASIKDKYPPVKIIENQKNFGFAKANNQAIRQAKGKYVLLLNSDTELKPRALLKLEEFSGEHEDAGVIGARLLNADGSVQPSVYFLPSIKGAFFEYWFKQKGTYEKYAPFGLKPIKVEAVVGAAMLIPKRVVNKIGLLDERYFMYFEDLDYCRRVKKAGLQVYYLPEAEIFHLHGKSGETIGAKTNTWLVESSKIYNGTIKYWFLTFIIWSGLKWQKIIGSN